MSDELRAEVQGLRERMAALEAQREADRQHDRDSRHAQGERMTSALGSITLQIEKFSADVGAQLTHQDACTDSVRVEAQAARSEVREVKSEVTGLKEQVTAQGVHLGRQAGQLEELDSRAARIETSLGERTSAIEQELIRMRSEHHMDATAVIRRIGPPWLRALAYLALGLLQIGAILSAHS